jgi:hypothetical protein
MKGTLFTTVHPDRPRACLPALDRGRSRSQERAREGVYLDVPDPSHVLLDGMRVHVTLDVLHRGVVVPTSAVVERGAVTEVFVVERGVLHRRRITVLFVSGEQTLVGSGLQGGETMAVDVPNDLRDGERVVARPQARPSPSGGPR